METLKIADVQRVLSNRKPQLKFAVVECRETLEFGRWGHSNDFDLWVPTTEERRIGRNKAKGTYAYRVTVAAMPGYAFISLYQLPELRRAAPGKFMVRPMYHQLTGNPKACTLADLQLLDKVLNAPVEEQLTNASEPAPAAEPELVLKQGVHVNCIAGPFTGQKGMVVCTGRKSTVRVLFGKQYVSIPRKLLILA